MPLSADDEVQERLNRLARMIGRVFGIEIGVDGSGDRLIFVDDDDEPIFADGDEIIAATKEEVDGKKYLDDFAVRAFRAALLAKNDEMERTRKP